MYDLRQQVVITLDTCRKLNLMFSAMQANNSVARAHHCLEHNSLDKCSFVDGEGFQQILARLMPERSRGYQFRSQLISILSPPLADPRLPLRSTQ